MQPSSMLRSCLRAQYLEGWVHLFAVFGPPLEANSGSSTALLHPYFCSPYIIYICIGVMHGVNSCIVKSRPFSSIISLGLTLLTASASATSLPGMCLISKLYGCILSNNLCSLGGVSEVDGLICLQTFCRTSGGGVSNTQTLLQAFYISLLASLILA